VTVAWGGFPSLGPTTRALMAPTPARAGGGVQEGVPAVKRSENTYVQRRRSKKPVIVATDSCVRRRSLGPNGSVNGGTAWSQQRVKE
jgi:hypothetical protein